MLESLFTYKQKQYPGISNSFEMLQGICKFFLPLFPMFVLDSLQKIYDRIRFSFENSSSYEFSELYSYYNTTNSYE